jgi:hypothetical protein
MGELYFTIIVLLHEYIVPKYIFMTCSNIKNKKYFLFFMTIIYNARII